MNTMTMTEVYDILGDIAAELDLDVESMVDTIDNYALGRGWEIIPEAVTVTIAARLIAHAVAEDLIAADEYLLDDAMAQMATREGWQFENHSVVLWTEHNGNETDTLVVWLGNDRDRDMSAVAREVLA